MFGREKAFMGTPLIKLFHRWPRGLELISHNQPPTGSNVPSTVLHRELAVWRVDEADHVSGDNDQVELTAEIHRCKVCESPIEFRRPTLCAPKQVGIEVDPDYLDTSCVEFDTDASETATSIERRLGFELHDEIDFTMRVLTIFGHAVPARFVIIEINRLAPLRPLG
jgi:hypothetical protein